MSSVHRDSNEQRTPTGDWRWQERDSESEMNEWRRHSTEWRTGLLKSKKSSSGFFYSEWYLIPSPSTTFYSAFTSRIEGISKARESLAPPSSSTKVKGKIPSEGSGRQRNQNQAEGCFTHFDLVFQAGSSSWWFQTSRNTSSFQPLGSARYLCLALDIPNI